MRPTKQLDSSIEIVTPENIAFRYEVAGPFRRMPAFLIDFGIRMMVFWLTVFLFGIAGLLTGFAGFAVLILIWFLFEWFYGALFETYWNGQTPGKRMIGIRVLCTDGKPINGLQAMVRNILRFADLMPLVPISALTGEPAGMGIPTAMIGLITPMLNSRFQRLGDIVSGTMVVIEDRSWLFGITSIEDPRAAQLAEYIPANFEIRRQLSRAVATYVERRRFFSPARRREISRHLAEPLLQRFHLPADTSYDLMVCALYHRAFVADQGREPDEDIIETVGQSPFSAAAVPTPHAATESQATESKLDSAGDADMDTPATAAPATATPNSVSAETPSPFNKSPVSSTSVNSIDDESGLPKKPTINPSNES